METFDAITTEKLPESAKTAIQFAMWSCEKAGFAFENGSTACYWHMLSILAQHMGAGTNPDPTSLRCRSGHKHASKHK